MLDESGLVCAVIQFAFQVSQCLVQLLDVTNVQSKMPAYYRRSVIADYKVASRLVDTFHQSAVRLRTQLSRAWNRFTHRLDATSGAACRCQRHTLKARSAWLLSDLRIRNPVGRTYLVR
jgi:hypothetical protein